VFTNVSNTRIKNQSSPTSSVRARISKTQWPDVERSDPVTVFVSLLVPFDYQSKLRAKRLSLPAPYNWDAPVRSFGRKRRVAHARPFVPTTARSYYSVSVAKVARNGCPLSPSSATRFGERRKRRQPPYRWRQTVYRSITRARGETPSPRAENKIQNEIACVRGFINRYEKDTGGSSLKTINVYLMKCVGLAIGSARIGQ